MKLMKSMIEILSSMLVINNTYEQKKNKWMKNTFEKQIHEQCIQIFFIGIFCSTGVVDIFRLNALNLLIFSGLEGAKGLTPPPKPNLCCLYTSTR